MTCKFLLTILKHVIFELEEGGNSISFYRPGRFEIIAILAGTLCRKPYSNTYRNSELDVFGLNDT